MNNIRMRNDNFRSMRLTCKRLLLWCIFRRTKYVEKEVLLCRFVLLKILRHVHHRTTVRIQNYQFGFPSYIYLVPLFFTLIPIFSWIYKSAAAFCRVVRSICMSVRRIAIFPIFSQDLIGQEVLSSSWHFITQLQRLNVTSLVTCPGCNQFTPKLFCHQALLDSSSTGNSI